MGICFALGGQGYGALFSILCNSSPPSPDFVSSFTFYLTLMVGLGYGIVWGLEQNEMFTNSACFSSTEGFSINSAVLNVRVFLPVSSPSSFSSFRPRTVSLLIQTAGKSKIRLFFSPQTPPLPLTLILSPLSLFSWRVFLNPLYTTLFVPFLSVPLSVRAYRRDARTLFTFRWRWNAGGLLMLGCFFFSFLARVWLCSV